MRMIRNDVLVEPILDFVSDGGIVLKFDFEPKVIKGKVVSIADKPECKDINIGDTVLFHKFAGKKHIENNKEYRIIPMVDILGIEIN